MLCKCRERKQKETARSLRQGVVSGQSGVQWNPANSVTNRPHKSGRINEVAISKGFFK